MSTEQVVSLIPTGLIPWGVFIGFCVGVASIHFLMEMYTREPQVIKPPEEVAPAEAAVEQTPRSQLKIAA